MTPGRSSRTAEYMALFRALEGTVPRAARLFDDPYALAMLSGGLRAVARCARLPMLRCAVPWLIDRGWPLTRSSGVVRTRLIDDAVEETLRGGAAQLVLLGAGLDSRPYRLSAASCASVFEVDHLRPEALFFASAPPFGSSGELRVTWLGTAGFILEHSGHVVAIDPYLTRASLWRCLFAPLRADEVLTRRLVSRADAILLSHTHFDHALDVPVIARHTGARVLGSRSAMNLCRSHGLPASQLECVEPLTIGEVPEAGVGPFRLRFWPSAHSAFLFGRVPFAGEIAERVDVPMRCEAYRCGAVFGVEIEVGGRRLFHVGSAELVERRWHVKPVDLVLACVAGWTATERYPERLVTALSPGAVLLHHWDNFLHALDGRASVLPAMRLGSLVERLNAAAPGVRVGALPILGMLRL